MREPEQLGSRGTAYCVRLLSRHHGAKGKL